MKQRQLCPFLLLSVVLWGLSLSQGFARAPATGKIVFTSARDGNREIYLMNPDGTQQVNLTQHPAEDLLPVWSPTGEHILFVSDRGGIRDLYLMASDGTHVRNVFGNPAYRSLPTWSPDGTQIAYARRELGAWFVSIVTLGQQKETRLASGTAPVWAPEGTAIAFLQRLDVPIRLQIRFLRVRTRTQRVFFPPRGAAPSSARTPAWSPSGDRLLFSWLHRRPLKDFQETETIYLINQDGTGLQQLVPEAGSRALNPAWSPRGDEFLYTQADGTGYLQIFRKALVGGAPVQLTSGGISYQANDLADWFDPAYALPVSPRRQVLTTQWGALKAKAP